MHTQVCVYTEHPGTTDQCQCQIFVPSVLLVVKNIVLMDELQNQNQMIVKVLTRHRHSLVARTTMECERDSFC